MSDLIVIFLLMWISLALALASGCEMMSDRPWWSLAYFVVAGFVAVAALLKAASVCS